MNILNIGASFLVEALRRQGHQVLAVGLGDECAIRVTHPLTRERLTRELAERGFVPDCALWIDNGNLPFLIGVEDLPFPSLFYAIDTFCNPWHVPFSYAFDMVLAAQKEYTELFPRLDEEAHWLPLFAPDGLFQERAPKEFEDKASGDKTFGAIERDIPVAFVGTLRPRNIPQRIVFLEAFRRLHPLFMMQGSYAPTFHRSLIVLNQTAAEEVNFRCFEAMACGAALLTEDSAQGLHDLFVPGVNMLPPYRRGDAAHAASIAREWLQQPQELMKVAEAGWELVRTQHTASHRAADVSAMMQKAVAGRLHERRLDELPRRKALLSTAYGILCEELTDPSLQAHRDWFRRMFEELAGA